MCSTRRTSGPHWRDEPRRGASDSRMRRPPGIWRTSGSPIPAFRTWPHGSECPPTADDALPLPQAVYFSESDTSEHESAQVDRWRLSDGTLCPHSATYLLLPSFFWCFSGIAEVPHWSTVPSRGQWSLPGGSAPATTAVPVAIRIQAPMRFDVASQIPARVIPAPARTRGSSRSLWTRYPRSTATIGFTNAMYERDVASIRFRSQRYVTKATTEPARLRYAIAKIPVGQDGTAHVSPARREAAAGVTAPVPIAKALRLTVSMSWPHRFTATLAAAAHVAARTIASIGKNRSADAASWARKMNAIPANPKAIPISFWTESLSVRRRTWAAIAVWNGNVAKSTAESPLATRFPSPQ